MCNIPLAIKLLHKLAPKYRVRFALCFGGEGGGDGRTDLPPLQNKILEEIVHCVVRFYI